VLEDGSDAQEDNWVRDVAWCNNIGATCDMLASVNENKKLKIWRQDPTTKEWAT